MSMQIVIDADRDFVRRTMRVLAARRDTTVSALVRQALDKCYGDELTEIERSFFQDSIAQAQHIVQGRKKAES